MQSVPRRSPIDQTADPMISSDGPVGETGKVSLYVSLVKLRMMFLSRSCAWKNFKKQKTGCLSQSEHQKGPKKEFNPNILSVFPWWFGDPPLNIHTRKSLGIISPLKQWLNMVHG